MHSSLDKNAKLLTSAQDNFVNELKKQGRASATILAYGKDLEQLVNFLALKEINQVDQITAALIEEFKTTLAAKKYLAKSVSRKLNSIKTFFRFLTQQGLIQEDPTQKVSYPRYETKTPRILSKMEYRALRDAVREDRRIAAVIEILLQTGLRISELARLELTDLQENQLKIRGLEGHPERIIPLNNSAQKAIKTYLDQRPEAKCQNLFVTKTGKQLLVRNIRAALDRYFRIAEVKEATVNDLRHTFIAHQLAAGTSVVTLQQLVGHKRLSTTEKYLQLVKNQTKSSIKLEEL
jgi:site-specific recombinase XerD